VHREEAARPLERALAGDSRAQQKGQKLLVGQGPGAQPEEPLSRPLLGGKVVHAKHALPRGFGHDGWPGGTARDTARTPR